MFVGYLVYNVKFADEDDKEDLVNEVKKKAIESHIISISAAFEGSFGSSEGGAGSYEDKRFQDALLSFFKKYDKNGDQVIDAFELRSLLSDLNEGIRHPFGVNNFLWPCGEMPESKFEAFLKEIDTDGSGTINFKEFTAAMKLFIEQKNKDPEAYSVRRIFILWSFFLIIVIHLASTQVSDGNISLHSLGINTPHCF